MKEMRLFDDEPDALIDGIRRLDGVTPVYVSGPPAAGKSTFVSERFEVGDVVVDVDELHKAFAFRYVNAAHPCLLPTATARWFARCVWRSILFDIDAYVRDGHSEGRFADGSIVWLTLSWPRSKLLEIASSYDWCSADGQGGVWIELLPPWDVVRRRLSQRIADLPFGRESSGVGLIQSAKKHYSDADRPAGHYVDSVGPPERLVSALRRMEDDAAARAPTSSPTPSVAAQDGQGGPKS
jgi:hypothetical protein